MTVGELVKESGDKIIVFRSIRNAQMMVPQMDQIKDFWSMWSPGAKTTGKHLIIDVDELP